METDATAPQRALETPEILEMILRSLPAIDLLLLQRTSRLWYGLIASSPQLQRTLFMRPDWDLEGKRNDPSRPINKPGERPRNNLLLRKVLGGAYPTMTLKMVSSDLQEEDDYLVRDPWELSPDFRPRRPDDKAPGGHWAWDISIAFPADRLPTSPASCPAIHYENASWRKMYLSQPPATSLHLCRRWQRASDAAIEDEQGITMGTFMDKASKAKESWNERFIGSDRDWHFEGPIRCSRFEPQDNA